MKKHPFLFVCSVTLLAVLTLSACSVFQILPGAKNAATEAPKAALTPTPAVDDASATAPILTCSFSESLGAITIDDQTANFTCGRLEGLDVVLFGSITGMDAGWQINRAYVAKTEDGFTVQNKDTGTVTAVDLGDGTRCEAVKPGTDVKIGDQKVVFTCGGQDNTGFVLMGDVIPGDQSWQVTKAAISKGDKGFSADSVEQVVIDSLEVQ
jgi:hypothetical protein